eukprot:754952-Hanusia_phi.AAC.3
MVTRRSASNAVAVRTRSGKDLLETSAGTRRKEDPGSTSEDKTSPTIEEEKREEAGRMRVLTGRKQGRRSRRKKYLVCCQGQRRQACRN